MADNAYLQQIRSEWVGRSKELADWILANLVNRTDVWGRYLSKKKRKNADCSDKKKGFHGNVVTVPFKDERGKTFLGVSSLEKHFKAVDGGVLGIHSAARDGTSRWFAIDIDRHDEEDLSVTAEGNFSVALGWYAELQKRGFDPLLMDSNGKGGFHIWVVFAEPMRSRSVRAFINDFVSDYKQRGLDNEPDLFPGTHGSNHLGSWLRLPGRHHSRVHYTRIYNDQSWDDRRWLEGHDAIDRILATRLAGRELLEKMEIKRSIKTVCLDFDGVIHSYRSGWQGVEHIPDPPIHGVKAAIAQLRKRYRVVVHSARGNTEQGREAIARWLARHEIEVDDICESKPPAFVYVDDRAIAFNGNWSDTIMAINAFRR